jgi:hypothetical protein
MVREDGGSAPIALGTSTFAKNVKVENVDNELRCKAMRAKCPSLADLYASGKMRSVES